MIVFQASNSTHPEDNINHKWYKISSSIDFALQLLNWWRHYLFVHERTVGPCLCPTWPSSTILSLNRGTSWLWNATGGSEALRWESMHRFLVIISVAHTPPLWVCWNYFLRQMHCRLLLWLSVISCAGNIKTKFHFMHNWLGSSSSLSHSSHLRITFTSGLVSSSCAHDASWPSIDAMSCISLIPGYKQLELLL